MAAAAVMELNIVQQSRVDAARDLITADAEGRKALAAHLGTTAAPDDVYPTAYGAARAHVRLLLEVIDQLTARGDS